MLRWYFERPRMKQLLMSVQMEKSPKHAESSRTTPARIDARKKAASPRKLESLQNRGETKASIRMLIYRG